MTESLQTDFEKIRALIHAAALPDDLMKTVTWCLDRLPGLYEAFVQTYESRYGDEIRRLVEGLFSYVGDAALTFWLPPTAIVLHADRDRLHQVVVNLLNNASKYTRERGHIWLKATVEGDEAVVRVENIGVGIAPEMLPRIGTGFAAGQGVGDAARRLGAGPQREPG